MSKYEIDNLKEDLPQASTSKKWSKSLKVWTLATVIVMIFIAITIKVSGYKIGENSKDKPLTLKTIVKTFKQQGFQLKEDNLKSFKEYELKGVKPAIFSIGDNRGTLLIYIFNSFVEREKIVKETNKFHNQYSFEEIPYNAKNSLIVFIPSDIQKTEENFENMGKTLSSISTTVFKYLNDGKERVYRGESASWEGTFTLKYYEHWFKDEEGKHHYESYSSEYPKIKYKMSDIDAVGSINFKYETSHGSGESTGLRLNKDGYANAGISGGNGSITGENNDIIFTVKWGNKEERFVLKAQ